MRPPVSACVIAAADAATIERCLASVAWADECVVVVDDRSRDETESLCRGLGARVLRHRYEGNVEQKNFAVSLAKHDWVIQLDADEALSEPLIREVQEALATRADANAGFQLGRVTHHLGRWIRHGDFHPDWQLRVFRRSAGRFEGRNPHGRVRVTGASSRLPGDLLHRSYSGLADQVERIQRFSTVEAEALAASGRRFRLRDLVLRPPARFLRGYLLKRGFLDGLPGFAIATASAFHVFLKYAKLWELERDR